MSISKELFLSILSMDAYNRGYGAGVSDPSAEDDTGLGVTNSQETYFIGGARIVADSSILVDANGNRLDQSAGFYSISYKMVAGEEIAGLSVGDTIISYRGTDNPDPLTWGDGASDVWQGWITGAGIPGSQSHLALDFFKAVTGDDALMRQQGDVILTGHSLGGGLAGLVAALSGDKAVLFDNMP